MMPVRIYISFFIQGKWEHSVFRDIKTLRESWDDTYSKQLWEFCIIHVGYERPEYNYESLIEALTLHPRPVFLTEAAKWALPSKFSDCTLEPVGDGKLSGKSKNIDLYIAINGWGYELSESDISIFNTPLKEVVNVKVGWISDLCKKSKNVSDIFDSCNIYDDKSFFTKKHLIQDTIRYTIENYRFETLKQQNNVSDPFSLVKIAPDWLLNCPVNRLDLTVRLANIFNSQNIVYVADLRSYTNDDFMKIKNFGLKSLNDLNKALIGTYQKYSANPDMTIDGAKEMSLHDHLQRAFAELHGNPRKIIIARFGADGNSPLTLQALGDIFGISRERIRQIEKKYLNRIIEKEAWDELIFQKISSLLNNRQTPLYLDMLPAEDSWFMGFENKFEFLREVVTRFSEGRVKSFSYDGREVISLVDQSDFDLLLKKIRDFIESNMEQGLTRASLNKLIKTECLGHGLSSLETIVMDSVNENLHYAVVEGSELLVGIGRGADSLVSVVLEEAESPLHYSEICKRVNQLSEVEIEMRRVHCCLTANKSAMLFDRGTYGLKRHLTVSQVVKDEILAYVEEIISNGFQKKQWHTSEILDILLEESYPDAERLNKYELGIILEESDNLIYLGKQIWMQKHSENISKSDRIQIMDAIIAVLKDAGKPLSAKDLLERVSKYRGVKSKLQIHPSQTLVKLESNLWGLVNRDLPFSVQEKDLYFNTLLNHLERTGKAIHISEVPIILRSAEIAYHSTLDPFVFLSLCVVDDRFKTWQGHLIGLSNWESPGRDNMRSAFRKILSTILSPTSTSEVQDKMQQLLGRPISKTKVSLLLSNSSATYDKKSEMWINPEAQNLGCVMDEQGIVQSGYV